MTAADWLLVAGALVATWVLAGSALDIWRDRPRPVRDPDGVWRASRRQRHGWGRP